MLRAVSSFATGRRSKFVVVAFWLALGFALAGFQPQLEEETTNESEAFLPASAEATEVNDLVEERFEGGRQTEAIIVYTRDGGLTSADRARIGSDAAALAEPGVLEHALPPLAAFDPRGRRVDLSRRLAEADAGPPGGVPRLVSEGSETALTVIPTVAENSEEVTATVEAIREVVPDSGGPGLRAYVSGTAGFFYDAEKIFSDIDGTLLTVTVALVLILLLAIYRSPVIAFVPLIVVGVAYTITAAVVLGLVRAGVFEINGQTTGILIVLMFGAGTDYALLIVARYREELRRVTDKHEAMRRATERTAPAILSAGMTVVLAMLVLTLADFKATQTMGPVLALGVLIMLAAGLTFLPALLAVLGRRAFWPAIPRRGSEQRRPVDIWRRIGHFVHERPVFVLAATVGLLAAGSLGNLNDRGIIDFGEGFREEVDSATGLELVREDLTPGQAAPSTAVAAKPVAARVVAALEAQPEVSTAVPIDRSLDGRLVRIEYTLTDSPFSDEAADAIPRLREVVAGVAGGELALLGGITAENYDTSRALSRDGKLIVPLVLVLIFFILAILLRALIAPLYLVATVVLSFGFALGASTLFFEHVMNQPDWDPGLPTFAFVFLVALGVDYNIFLISRIREEAAYQPTREAVITGLERTGGVITSAGLILAGTFSALMALPLEALFQFGFTIALGLLVDTFIVRTVMVPSIAFMLGERSWWPSRLSHDAARPDQPMGAD